MSTAMTVRAVEAGYLATVAGLTAAAFSGPETLRWAQVAAALLTLPTLLAALPLVYLLGAWAWTFADSASSGSATSTDPSAGDGSIWPVTLTFTLLMTLVACANVAVARWSVALIRTRRAASG